MSPETRQKVEAAFEWALHKARMNASGEPYTEYHENLRKATAALALLREDDGWREISTAPKGEDVFVWREGWDSAHLAKQIQRDSEKEDGSECWFWGWSFKDESVCYGVEDGFLGWIEDESDKCMPTHWMHKPTAWRRIDLPTPPKGSEG
jgi:hypothetical protein